MKLKHVFIAVFFCTCVIPQLKAQDSVFTVSKKPADTVKHQMNFFKINLMALPLRTYSFQIERIITRKFSVAFAYRVMPDGKIPFANRIADEIGDDNPDDVETIKNVRIGNYAITPELRFYLGKGYGKGFYIGAYYRYSDYTASQIPIKYDDVNSLNFNGKLTANTGGIMFGAQFFLGKHIALDWWIFGPQYGFANGNMNGVSSKPLTQAEQDELYKNLNDIDIPSVDKTIYVNANGARMVVSGPWAGIRTGFCFAVKF